MSKIGIAFLALSFGLPFGFLVSCATSEPPGSAGTAGTGSPGAAGTAGGTTGIAGTTGAAGITGGAGSTGAAGTTSTGSGGTTETAGTTGATGVAGSGATGRGGTTGAAGGGGTTGAAGRGGTTGAAGAAGTTGVAGTTGGGGTAGPGSPAVPSAGCAKMAARPSGGKVTVANDHIYDFPASYDGKMPMPLLIALHGAGNPYTQLEGLTNGTRLETNFVRAFPKSAGSGWVLSTDAPHITTVYNELLANYCIDTSRVFLTGHSSGAQMDVQMLCVSGGEKRFKAVAPVAASKYCAKVSPIPVMYIQGMMDMMRGDSNGIDVVNFFTSSNMCGTTSVPDTAVATCNSMLDGKPVTPGCVTYQGCTAPTVWCSHNDNSYNSTDGNMHGWPCFASNAMADFFLGLP